MFGFHFAVVVEPKAPPDPGRQQQWCRRFMPELSKVYSGAPARWACFYLPVFVCFFLNLFVVFSLLSLLSFFFFGGGGGGVGQAAIQACGKGGQWQRALELLALLEARPSGATVQVRVESMASGEGV